MQYYKITSDKYNRIHYSQFRGLVLPAVDLHPDMIIRDATPFEILTQTKGYSGRGADMGRSNVGPDWDDDPANDRIFDRVVPLCSGGYDRGGAYWGIGARLRVRYTKDLLYVRYYREEFENDPERPGFKRRVLPS